METRVAVLSIIVENEESVGELNELLPLTGALGRIRGITAKANYSRV